MADKSKVGKQYATAPWEVERCKIRELVQAIGDTNPIYVDKQAAIKEGYKDTPAPPTYITVPGNWQSQTDQFMKDLNINYMKIVHGGEEYEYHREIYPGDVLTGKTTVASIVEKQGKSGSMDIVTIETVYTDQKNQKVLTARTTIIERK